MAREASASAPKIEEPNPNRGEPARPSGTDRYGLSMIGSTNLVFTGAREPSLPVTLPALTIRAAQAYAYHDCFVTKRV